MPPNKEQKLDYEYECAELEEDCAMPSGQVPSRAGRVLSHVEVSSEWMQNSLDVK